MNADIDYGAVVNKKYVQDWWIRNGKMDLNEAVSIMANATMVPCINVAYWLAEADGWSQHGKNRVDSISKFYGYEEILNIPENCPW